MAEPLPTMGDSSWLEQLLNYGGNPGALYTAGLNSPEFRQQLGFRQLADAAKIAGQLSMPSRAPIGIGAFLGQVGGAAGGVGDEVMDARLKGAQALQAQYLGEAYKAVAPYLAKIGTVGGGTTAPGAPAATSGSTGGGVGGPGGAGAGAGDGGVISLAMQESPEVQEAVAKKLATTSGIQHWSGIDPKTGEHWNPKLVAALKKANLPISGPLTEEQWNQANPLIKQYESDGGKNIKNYKFGPGFTAGGTHQITNTTWNMIGGPEIAAAMRGPKPDALPLLTPRQPGVNIPPAPAGETITVPPRAGAPDADAAVPPPPPIPTLESTGASPPAGAIPPASAGGNENPTPPAPPPGAPAVNLGDPTGGGPLPLLGATPPAPPAGATPPSSAAMPPRPPTAQFVPPAPVIPQVPALTPEQRQVYSAAAIASGLPGLSGFGKLLEMDPAYQAALEGAKRAGALPFDQALKLYQTQLDIAAAYPKASAEEKAKMETWALQNGMRVTTDASGQRQLVSDPAATAAIATSRGRIEGEVAGQKKRQEFPYTPIMPGSLFMNPDTGTMTVPNPTMVDRQQPGTGRTYPVPLYPPGATPPTTAPGPGAPPPGAPGPGAATGSPSDYPAKLGPGETEELTGAGKAAAERRTEINTQFGGAQQERVTLNAMQDTLPSVYTGKGQAFNQWLNKTLGMLPGYDENLAKAGKYEALVKNAGQLTRQAVKDTSARAAVQEFRLIQDALPGPDMTQPGLARVLNEYQGLNDYKVALGRALAAHESNQGGVGNTQQLERWFGQSASPMVFVYLRMSPEDKASMAKTVSQQPGGTEELQRLLSEATWIKQNLSWLR